MIKGVHHFGIRVENLDKEVKFYKGLGYKLLYNFTLDNINSKATMLIKNGTCIELFEFPDDSSEFAQKIKKHSALVTDNIEEDVQKFLDNGYELAIPIDTGKVMKKYAYVKDKMGNYIELCMPPEQ